VSVHQTRATATDVAIPVGDAVLQGDLVLPEAAVGIVLFAHGSGSGRHSPRNRQVRRR
jgi:putative phosphoribosyl transferase